MLFKTDSGDDVPDGCLHRMHTLQTMQSVPVLRGVTVPRSKLEFWEDPVSPVNPGQFSNAEQFCGHYYNVCSVSP